MTRMGVPFQAIGFAAAKYVYEAELSRGEIEVTAEGKVIKK